ncbi:unnamed protein product [Darwinula stevensoni]|uniref:Uncharacterized protein n=1 Tax=Darwinula stevensoni TaxID=69355 RepID=A0A7R8XBW3_9CRUS|nr:unnamed protein product [Darwinula stevensoni]CAG0893218.1 unnamed protein product [Darwinula stevensoni]
MWEDVLTGPNELRLRGNPVSIMVNYPESLTGGRDRKYEEGEEVGLSWRLETTFPVDPSDEVFTYQFQESPVPSSTATPSVDGEEYDDEEEEEEEVEGEGVVEERMPQKEEGESGGMEREEEEEEDGREIIVVQEPSEPVSMTDAATQVTEEDLGMGMEDPLPESDQLFCSRPNAWMGGHVLQWVDMPDSSQVEAEVLSHAWRDDYFAKRFPIPPFAPKAPCHHHLTEQGQKFDTELKRRLTELYTALRKPDGASNPNLTVCEDGPGRKQGGSDLGYESAETEKDVRGNVYDSSSGYESVGGVGTGTQVEEENESEDEKEAWRDMELLQYEMEDVLRLERRVKEDPLRRSLANLRRRHDNLMRQLTEAKHRLGINRQSWSFDVHVVERMKPDCPGFMEALEQETKVLHKRVLACQSRVLVATCFDISHHP